MTRRPPWPPSAARPLASPLQPSAVYVAESPDSLDAQYDGDLQGYAYAREGHPNADNVAGMIDAMEGASGGLVTGSGMAAVTAALLGSVEAGQHVLGGDQLYGRSLRLLSETLPALGITTSTADATDASAMEAALRPETRLVLVEVISNPTLRVADIAGIAAFCQARGILLAIDNTFTTPLGFRPFDAGADLVIHSVTKLLAGHSDATLGYVVARDPELQARIQTLAITMGLTPSAFDCWLAERGMLSFELRYARAEANARALADALADMPNVSRVLHPHRPDHPDRARTLELLGNRGSHMLSFEIKGGRDAANRLVAALPEMPFAPTLGDVSTTLSHPASSSHRALSTEARAAMGISEGFFRVSAGCEPTETLVATLRKGLGAL